MNLYVQIQSENEKVQCTRIITLPLVTTELSPFYDFCLCDVSQISYNEGYGSL